MHGEKLRVLVVGSGSIGERHVRCFTATRRVTVGIVETNSELRRTVADRYGIAETFADLKQAQRSGFDAAVIATPAPLHVPMARQLASANLHVLIEKPLALGLQGIGELQSVVGSQCLVAAVAYVYRAHPALAAMRAAIQEGRFGRPLQIVATCGQHFPTYRPAYRETYFANRASGGGAVQDALTHVINAGEWLVGPATRVTADVGRLALDGVEVEDTAHVMARHGQVMGCYSLNQHQAPNEVVITVVCENGTARFNFHHNTWSWMTAPSGTWQQEQAADVQRDTLFIRQADVFLDAIEGKSDPLCTLAQGLQTLKVNMAILQSAEHGIWLPIEPASTQDMPHRPISA